MYHPLWVPLLRKSCITVVCSTTICIFLEQCKTEPGPWWMCLFVFFLYERPEILGLLVHKLHIVQSLPSPRERFLANCSDCILEPKYQTAFVVWSLGMSISEVAGLCNYFGRHEDLEVQLCHPVVTNISESTSFRLLLSPGSLILGKKLTAAVQDIVIRPLLLSKVVEKLWSWNICHQHQQYPCYGSIFQPENKSCAKSKQQQFPCCVLSSNAVHSQY